MERQGRITAVERLEKGVRVSVLMSDKVPKVGDSVRLAWGKKRTHDQNSLYWKFLEDVLFECGLAEQAGYVSAEELHEDLKGRYLVVREMSPHGVWRYRIKSTTELDIGEFHDYMEKCNKLFVEFFNIDTSYFWDDYEELYSKHRG